MKTLILFLLIAPLFGANTTVTGILLDGTQTPVSGTIYINPSRDFICQGTNEVVESQIQVVVPETGVYAIGLCPNDTGNPTTTYYNVRAVLKNNAKGFAEIWKVPTSGSPVSRSTVRITAPPSPSYAFSLLQLLSGGASLGDLLTWNGGFWVKLTPPTINFAAANAVVFTHNLGRQYPVFECYSGGGQLEPASVVPLNSNVLVITFDSTKTGSCSAF